VVSHDPPQQRVSWARHGTRGFYLSPALSHYRTHVVFIPSTLAKFTRITNQLDFFPDPLFTFEDPTVSAPPPDPTSSRPSPTLDGSDLIGQSFVDPDLGLCLVTGAGQPTFLQPHTGNLAPGLRLSPGWHPTLSYTTLTGTVEQLHGHPGRQTGSGPSPSHSPSTRTTRAPTSAAFRAPSSADFPAPSSAAFRYSPVSPSDDGDHPRTCRPPVRPRPSAAAAHDSPWPTSPWLQRVTSLSLVRPSLSLSHLVRLSHHLIPPLPAIRSFRVLSPVGSCQTLSPVGPSATRRKLFASPPPPMCRASSPLIGPSRASSIFFSSTLRPSSSLSPTLHAPSVGGVGRGGGRGR
jgi:hypothetical protein